MKGKKMVAIGIKKHGDPDWKLYQEPQADPFEEALDALDEREAEKCEHKETYINYLNEKIFCANCKTELVEKWLWIVKGEGFETITHAYHTEDEAKNVSNDDEIKLIKKATWSRELFEVER